LGQLRNLTKQFHSLKSYLPDRRGFTTSEID
jgi:hypothetical protein